jgi:hypothetical protein
MVLDANVREAFGNKDVRDPGDMRVFAKRVAAKLRYAPDIVLLQEVRGSSAREVAKFLTQTTNHAFKVARGPQNPFWVGSPRKVKEWEDAVLVNTDTMRVTNNGGYITTSYRRSEAARGDKVDVKHYAWARLARRDGTLEVDAASLHHVPNFNLRSASVADRLKKKWSLEVLSKLRSLPSASSGPSHIIVFGGDFNAQRCYGNGNWNCRTTPFYSALVGHGMADAVWSVIQTANGDFIWSNGAINNAGADLSYNSRQAESSSTYYSDHAFKWALLGTKDTNPPSKPDIYKSWDYHTSPPPAKIRLWWDKPASRDAEGGVVDYKIYRSKDGQNFKRIALNRPAAFTDTHVTKGTRYWYFVKACDRSYNCSGASNVVTLKAGVKN